MDSGCDATLLIKSGCLLPAEGAKFERLYAESGVLPNPSATANPEFRVLLSRWGCQV